MNGDLIKKYLSNSSWRIKDIAYPYLISKRDQAIVLLDYLKLNSSKVNNISLEYYIKIRKLNGGIHV